jgi:hypothetical protein
MRRRTLLALATAFIPLALAGCGDDNDKAAQDPRAAAEELQAQSVERATVDAVFGALCGIKMNCGGLDRDLPAHRQQVVEHARAICDVLKNQSEDAAITEARKRLSNGKFKVDQKKGGDVVHILKLKICPIV